MAIASMGEMFFANRLLGTHHAQNRADLQAVATPNAAQRCLVWIDGVGSYLLLAADRVTIGRSGNNADSADIALMGPLSRQHATLIRIADDYVIEPHHATNLNAQRIDQATVLSDGAEIALNESVKFKFCLPTPLSTTARLDTTSSHRGPVSVNGIVLLAETCLFGPGPENHVRCPNWSSSVVLIKRPSGFAVRSHQEITIDGQQHTGLSAVAYGQTIAGPDFRFRMEEYGSGPCIPRLI